MEFMHRTKRYNVFLFCASFVSFRKWRFFMNKNQILFCVFLFMIIFYCAKPCLAGGKFQYSLSEKGVLTVLGEGKLERVD